MNNQTHRQFEMKADTAPVDEALWEILGPGRAEFCGFKRSYEYTCILVCDGHRLRSRMSWSRASSRLYQGKIIKRGQRVTAIELGRLPAGKGEPAMAVSAPVLGLIVYPKTLLPP